ncbi:MAG: ParA family protein [Planctomycetota bacterium]|jgi:chromosome partitioning protein
MSEAANLGDRARTFAVMNQKGGVGKTTTAVSLGAALAEVDRRVCLIDLDPQAHLTLHLGIDTGGSNHTVYDLLIDPACEVSHCRVTARPNLDVIPAELDLAAAETELSSHPDRQRILGRKLAAVVDSYDFVFVDCPPSLGLLTVNALSLAGEVLVPMQAHFLALQGVGKLLETVRLVCRSVNPALRVVGIVLCMHEAQTTLAKEVVADLDSFFESARGQEVPWRDCRVLRPAIRRNVKLAEAPSFGKTIFDYAPWCAGANDYRILAERLLAETEAARDGRPPPAEPTPIVTVSPAGRTSKAASAAADHAPSTREADDRDA